MDRDTKNRTENQSGAGVPQSKVRPECLTGKVSAQPVKFMVLFRPSGFANPEGRFLSSSWHNCLNLF